MNKTKRILFNVFLSAVTCLFLIGISSSPSFSNVVRSPQSQSTSEFSSAQLTSNLDQVEQLLLSNLREADSISIAQGMSASPITRYVVVMAKNNVVPMSPSTSAFGAAGAVLAGDRLIVRGDYSNLSSALRDYAADPVDPPNPNITSGIHIHQGDLSANGPFQYALEVTPNEDELSGRFAGEYTLTSEQLQALSNGQLYLDLHTSQNRGGELRGIFQPY
jgi:hypothetical protein